MWPERIVEEVESRPRSQEELFRLPGEFIVVVVVDWSMQKFMAFNAVGLT